jgi:hypothetical protein
MRQHRGRCLYAGYRTSTGASWTRSRTCWCLLSCSVQFSLNLKSCVDSCTTNGIVPPLGCLMIRAPYNNYKPQTRLYLIIFYSNYSCSSCPSCSFRIITQPSHDWLLILFQLAARLQHSLPHPQQPIAEEINQRVHTKCPSANQVRLAN